MKKKGFTLIELLVVIAIIALLLSIVMPALGKAKTYAQRLICRSNLRQQALGITLYANDHDSLVPDNNMGGWLWDMTFLATTQLSNYAGFDDNETFFCPANKMKRASDARFWQYSYLWPGPYPNPEPLRDETQPPLSNNLRSYYRVLPFIYMFDKPGLPGHLLTGERSTWISKLSNVRASGSQIMAMDAIISDSSGTKFQELTNGGIDDLSAGNLTDNTNHMSKQNIGTGTSQGPKPAGANIAYADGHADWKNTGTYNPTTRQFDNIKDRVSTGGMHFWW